MTKTTAIIYTVYILFFISCNTLKMKDEVQQHDAYTDNRKAYYLRTSEEEFLIDINKIILEHAPEIYNEKGEKTFRYIIYTDSTGKIELIETRLNGYNQHLSNRFVQRIKHETYLKYYSFVDCYPQDYSLSIYSGYGELRLGYSIAYSDSCLKHNTQPK